MNKTASTIMTVIGRIFATFVYQAMAVIGGASIIGGIDTTKAALLSGITAVATVLQKLAAAYADDGKITLEELDAAFRMNSAPSSTTNQADG
jgi:hypothetical protein|tara:strand:+ start:90 stop:365 length:276 start_codon:yes stop_codon:yes gene_type:complete